jgi:hypothetical protein
MPQGYDEQAIHFPPTFKLIPHTGQYHLKRVPSWTDRVLHKVLQYTEHHKFELEPLFYR